VATYAGQVTTHAVGDTTGSQLSFADAIRIEPTDRPGVHRVRLSPLWSVGDKPHGGYLMAICARAAQAGTVAGDGTTPDPLVVSTQFMAAPDAGPAELHTTVLRAGRSVSVARVTLRQGDRDCLDTTVTLGRLPAAARPDYDAVPADLAAMPVEPPDDALNSGADGAFAAVGPTRQTDVRIDRATTGFLHGRFDQPLRLRMWLRPRDAPPDPVFALFAVDASPPLVMMRGRFGWAPTIQLTALLRARPAPGWLRLVFESRSMHGDEPTGPDEAVRSWFDEDATAIDSAGVVVAQGRQLALSRTRRRSGPTG
jgi:hypothetical protein